MQYIGRCHNFVFLPVASNDNDDLLSFSSPIYDLLFIRDIKEQLLSENRETGMLLSSRKERRFLQEVLDSERYILMRYFIAGVKEQAIQDMKRHILDNYLFPKGRRKKPNKKQK